MCGEVVAAPLSLQDTVYPILRKKSLHFCEKSKKFLKLCTAVRKKYKMKRLRGKTDPPQSKPDGFASSLWEEPLARPEACALVGKLLLAISVQGRSAGPEAGRGVPTPPSLPLDSTHPAMQQLRPPPAAETGRSCWGSGQQDASAVQGTKRMLGAATRRQGLHALDKPKEEVEAQKS